jgi:hypothetical protein
MPFRPSTSDFGYIEEGESTVGYTFTPWELLLGHSGTRNLHLGHPRVTVARQPDSAVFTLGLNRRLQPLGVQDGNLGFASHSEEEGIEVN